MIEYTFRLHIKISISLTIAPGLHMLSWTCRRV